MRTQTLPLPCDGREVVSDRPSAQGEMELIMQQKRKNQKDWNIPRIKMQVYSNNCLRVEYKYEIPLNEGRIGNNVYDNYT